jgi:hypothetical protein
MSIVFQALRREQFFNGVFLSFTSDSWIRDLKTRAFTVYAMQQILMWLALSASS